MVSIENRHTFPYPFGEQDVYRYSNNAIPLNPPIAIEVTESYLEELNLKRGLQTNHPEHCCHSMSHTLNTQWEMLDLILHHLASFYPENYQLVINNDHWIFTNQLTGEIHSFTFGNHATLDVEPLDSRNFSGCPKAMGFYLPSIHMLPLESFIQHTLEELPGIIAR